MAQAKALTARRVETLTSKRKGKEGWVKDAAERGLYLQITRLATLDKPAAASWVLRYTLKGTEYYHGLGSLQDFSLEEARQRARKARQQIADGINPVEVRKADKATAALAKAKTITFKKASEEFYEANHRDWESLVHRQQYLSTMDTYVLPTLGNIAVADIDRPLILRVLEPIWRSKTETASRVRQRIEGVLALAMARGYRPEGLNPARWKGGLDQVLPKPTRVSKVVSHPSLPYAEIPQFMRDLKSREGFAAAALRLTVLTAARTNEVIAAQWSEFDLAEAIWTVPASRMKARKEHTVPLSNAALDLLRALPREGEIVFCGMHAGTSISNMSMSALLKRMKRDAVTVHGFRSSFRTWAADRTAFPDAIVEACLAHVITDPVVKAYKRTTMLDKRRKVMEAWAAFCYSEPVQSSAKVIALRG